MWGVKSVNGKPTLPLLIIGSPTSIQYITKRWKTYLQFEFSLFLTLVLMHDFDVIVILFQGHSPWKTCQNDFQTMFSVLLITNIDCFYLTMITVVFGLPDQKVMWAIDVILEQEMLAFVEDMSSPLICCLVGVQSSVFQYSFVDHCLSLYFIFYICTLWWAEM